MKAVIGKFGAKHDYRHAHCTLTIKGETMLGEILDMWWDQVTGGVRCRVRYMNGELWAIEPMLSALDILDRAEVVRVVPAPVLEGEELTIKRTAYKEFA